MSFFAQQVFDPDTNSEISFIKRQKELRELFTEFREALDSMKDDEEKELEKLKKNSYYTPTKIEDANSTYIIYEDEIRGILDEIRMLISEVIGIKSELRASSYQCHMELFEKLDNVIQILTSQRQRAEALLIN